MNRELARGYEKALPQLLALPGGVSKPLLMQVPSGYGATPQKLMIVGQETKGWGPKGAQPSVADLMGGYAGFNLGANYRRNPFWVASHQLHRALNPDAPEPSFLWSNLVKVDQNERRPTAEVEETVARLGLLAMEIGVTRPDVVVFFTGPRYDARLEATFPGARLEEAGPKVSRVVHRDLPELTFRTYHPGYLRRSRQWAVLSELASLASKN
jgi:hypothetical protein